jgi:putative transcriptional regulator
MESVLDILFGVLYTHRWKANFPSMKGSDAVKNRLEEIRKQRGIRQEELATALEVSRQTIGSLENGRYNPSIVLAFKIARYFGMTIEEIFIYEEEQGNETI